VRCPEFTSLCLYRPLSQRKLPCVNDDNIQPFLSSKSPFVGNHDAFITIVASSTSLTEELIGETNGSKAVIAYPSKLNQMFHTETCSPIRGQSDKLRLNSKKQYNGLCIKLIP
jgi:hypothetical protein